MPTYKHVTEVVAAQAPRNFRPGLGPLYAGYALRKSQPVGIVTLGSSTTEGATTTSAANRWVNKFIGHLQAAYPNGATESAVGTLSTARITTAGIHGYNGGLGGTTSANYLTDAKVTQIQGLAPRVITHMIGSNDMANNMALSTYRANLVGWLNKLDAAVPAPYVNVLVHAQPRSGWDAGFTHTWAQYGQVLNELAQERPNCVFVDLSGAYLAIGLPAPDTLDLMTSDLVHMNDAGHDMMARLMAQEFGAYTPAGTTTAPPATTSAPAVQTAVLATESFTGADVTDIVGRTLDNALGGSKALTWTSGEAGQWGITNGQLTRTGQTNTSLAGVQMTIPDYELSFTVAGMNLSGALFVALRRQGTTGQPDDYRLEIGGGGTQITLGSRKSLGVASWWTGSGVVVGDRITFRVKDTTLTLLKNGVELRTYVDASANPITSPGYAGLVTINNSGTGWKLDNVAISAIL